MWGPLSLAMVSSLTDCLHVQLYRDSRDRCRGGPTKASLSLESFLGTESGFTLDKESNTLALVCSEVTVVLAFDSRELLMQWQVKVRANLPEEQQFLVQVSHAPPKSKLPCGPARLHLQDHSFCLVNGVPPRLLGTWPLKELRRFGPVEGKFCFEGGSLCGKGEGLHVLLTNQCEELAHAMDLASKGKLLGKRKTLTRKNSMLESSTRAPLHKRCHGTDSSASGTSSVTGSDGGDACSCRPLLSSAGSECCSTCDECSERGDDLMSVYAAGSTKASSCRIHYRWPSCLSRWGQSSTTTTSDVDSVDTVSVILSDFQGSQSATMSKTNGHGQSLSCLCDTQGTWPFNQCTKCGRQFYSRGSIQSCKGSKPSSSPIEKTEDTSGFSPQWTMDSLIGSSTNGPLVGKKESAYQRMNPPPSDRASLCSRASQNSSHSSASSGSEYSVPKNFADSLYDKPKNMHVNGFANGKSPDLRRNGCNNDHLCPCHEPIQDFSGFQDRIPGKNPECACWSKLSMIGDADARLTTGRKSASANPSPSSSPKKSRYNGSSLQRSVDCECACDKGNYATPKSAIASVKDVTTTPPSQMNGCKNGKFPGPSSAAEDYDVPKKFTDLLSNCDMTQKNPSIKTMSNGPSSCSCMNACKMVPNMEFFKMVSKHSYASQNSSLRDHLQMCACQRVMLWAGNLVPCLGPQAATQETGWQCTKSFNNPRTWCSSQMSAVCSEPHRTAEAVMTNGKVKHVLRSESSVDHADTRSQSMRHPFRPRASTVSYPLTMDHSDSSQQETFNYANIDFSTNQESEKVLKVSDDSSTLNYANIEFAETLPLYENSNLVLSRLEPEDKMAIPPCQSKPPLPPRAQLNVSKVMSSDSKENGGDKCQCKQQPPSSVNRSPKKSALRQLNGSAYEMMNYEKISRQSEEDYLLMQPLCMQEDNTSPSKKINTNRSDCPSQIQPHSEQNCDLKEDITNAQSVLPLRPFMPYSYPISENINSSLPEGISGSSMSRKNQLINEDLQIRAMRSNSLSELKKKVLMRKRSSSVDGKNNGYLSKDSGTESVPASPVSSPRPSNIQRKNSLFSKLNLRSKEKSSSTNEIALPPLPSSRSPVSNFSKSLHRSADCLKLASEEFGNSDDDLNSDSSDFVLQKDSCHLSSPMKRSRSVPCKAGGIPTSNTSVSSPVRTSETILELNDLNKEESVPDSLDSNQEPVQRKYSLDSHDRSKQRTSKRVGSNCDNVYRQERLDESDTVMEMQGVLRRQIPTERGQVCRSNTSSCSSSDISDYMESLSFISRSSSSSSASTSSADYMRSEELYLLRTTPRAPPKPPAIAIPSPRTDLLLAPKNNRLVYNSDDASSIDTATSSSGSYQDSTTRYRPIDDTRACSTRDSRSSTSSTSSLSTSPGVTDYSSSSSSSPPCQKNLMTTPRLAKRREESAPRTTQCSCAEVAEKSAS
ncbi:hypothetical protein JTE90_006051 [Oedothorax gibbosus]|uniref:IRS-type PTB domain-containing protein n=1 Tax=Oedothorax gibbosus TaxID=931172 RepID=A0AAV6V476_9ARAC|nr:hypothetical protein JTE90_006051 [Oedothorax gibbosus]